MSHQTPKRSEGRYGRRGRMPVCRRCRKADATVNAYCGACYDILYPPVVMTESELAERWNQHTSTCDSGPNHPGPCG